MAPQSIPAKEVVQAAPFLPFLSEPRDQPVKIQVSQLSHLLAPLSLSHEQAQEVTLLTMPSKIPGHGKTKLQEALESAKKSLPAAPAVVGPQFGTGAMGPPGTFWYALESGWAAPAVWPSCWPEYWQMGQAAPPYWDASWTGAAALEPLFSKGFPDPSSAGDAACNAGESTPASTEVGGSSEDESSSPSSSVDSDGAGAAMGREILALLSFDETNQPAGAEEMPGAPPGLLPPPGLVHHESPNSKRTLTPPSPGPPPGLAPPPGLHEPAFQTPPGVQEAIVEPPPGLLPLPESTSQAINATNVIQCLDFLEAAIEQEAAEPETLEHSLQAKAEEAAVEQTAVEEKEPLVLEPEAAEEESAEEEAVAPKASVAAPTPQELKAAALILAKSCRKGNKSQGKGRTEPKQQRNKPALTVPDVQPSQPKDIPKARAAPRHACAQSHVTVVPVPHKVVVDIDANSIEDKVVWWQVLLTLGLVTFLLVAFVAIRPARLMSSGAHASLSVAPGISNALATVVPAGASLHMRDQLVSSLAKTMDVEFARANAVASFLKSKISDVRRARKIRREKKVAHAAAEEQARAAHGVAHGQFQTWHMMQNGGRAHTNTVG